MLLMLVVFCVDNMNISLPQLDTYEDLAYLGAIPKLFNLRIDENPICQQAYTFPFVIFSVPALQYLNGQEITNEDRFENSLVFVRTALKRRKKK